MTSWPPLVHPTSRSPRLHPWPVRRRAHTRTDTVLFSMMGRTRLRTLQPADPLPSWLHEVLTVHQE